jgi:mercuric ion transport protein
MPILSSQEAGPQNKPAIGMAFLTAGGLAAAFGVASCCALPLLLTTLGLSTAWLGGVAMTAAPHRELLLIVGAAALLGGTILLWRQQRVAATCAVGQVCMPKGIRIVTFVGLIAGAGLLWAGYRYA